MLRHKVTRSGFRTSLIIVVSITTFIIAQMGTPHSNTVHAQATIELITNLDTFPADGEETIIKDNPFVRSALAGFSFIFPDTDHHLRVIKTERYSDSAVVNFQDMGYYTEFEYSITYQKITDRAQVRSTGLRTCGGGTCVAYLSPPADHTFVLLGFYFEFLYSSGTGIDRHIKKIAINPRNSDTQLAVTYSDQTVDSTDDYNWSVQYMWVPNDVIEGVRSQRLTFNGSTCVNRVAAIPYAALRSFTLEYTDGTDHHIKRMALWLRGLRVCAALQDNDGAESAAADVGYVDFSSTS